MYEDCACGRPCGAEPMGCATCREIRGAAVDGSCYYDEDDFLCEGYEPSVYESEEDEEV